MHTEKRIINGTERDVQCYGSEQEYLDSEKDRRNMEHADRVASQLASNKKFISSIADAIMNAPIDTVGLYTASIPVQQSGDYKDSDERKGR